MFAQTTFMKHHTYHFVTILTLVEARYMGTPKSNEKGRAFWVDRRASMKSVPFEQRHADPEAEQNHRRPRI